MRNNVVAELRKSTRKQAKMNFGRTLLTEREKQKQHEQLKCSSAIWVAEDSEKQNLLFVMKRSRAKPKSHHLGRLYHWLTSM